MIAISSHCCAAYDEPLRGWLPNGSQMSHRSLSIATAHYEFAYSSSNGSSPTTEPYSGAAENVTKTQPFVVVLSPRI
jgi:hypothetical protein